MIVFGSMKRMFLVIMATAVALAACGGTDDAVAQPEPEEIPEVDEQSATERALAELAAAYEGVSGLLGQGSDEAVDRVQEDIENLGDWEYRVAELSSASSEVLETELNTLGNERWEAYWVEPSVDGVRVYLKRPSISYLSRVPLSALVRMLAGGGE